MFLYSNNNIMSSRLVTVNEAQGRIIVDNYGRINYHLIDIKSE